jgi:hypothetical protein
MQVRTGLRLFPQPVDISQCPEGPFSDQGQGQIARVTAVNRFLRMGQSDRQIWLSSGSFDVLTLVQRP